MAVTKRKLGEDSLDQFVCSANEVIKFHFILDEEGVEEDEKAFEPEFTHQFFGESENIFGYIGLQIKFFYSACNLFPFFGMTFREKVKPTKTGGIQPDNVYKIISDKMDIEPSTDLDAFVLSLREESSFKPYGELLSTFTAENSKTYGVYRADSTTPGFKEYHRRMETLILWFIDAASYIDDDDERWEYFVLHEHLKHKGEDFYPFVGYSTVYRYYAYPFQIRPRISQMLVLPSHQKQGLGSKLLEAISSWYVKDEKILDITVEDPSEEFIRIRDFNDCRRCRSLPSFAVPKLCKGFSLEMQEEARDGLKINKKQARRVYEILRLWNTDLKNREAYRAYRLDVKNRLNIPFERERLDMEKLQKTLNPEELKAAANPIPREQRIEQLDHTYTELEEKYKHIIERLETECKE